MKNRPDSDWLAHGIQMMCGGTGKNLSDIIASNGRTVHAEDRIGAVLVGCGEVENQPPANGQDCRSTPNRTKRVAYLDIDLGCLRSFRITHLHQAGVRPFDRHTVSIPLALRGRGPTSSHKEQGVGVRRGRDAQWVEVNHLRSGRQQKDRVRSDRSVRAGDCHPVGAVVGIGDAVESVECVLRPLPTAPAGHAHLQRLPPDVCPSASQKRVHLPRFQIGVIARHH